MSVLKYKDPKTGTLKPLTTYVVGGGSDVEIATELGESNEKAISQKAVTDAFKDYVTQTEFDLLESTVGECASEESVGELQNQMSLKADRTDLNDMATETFVEGKVSEINQKLDDYAKIPKLTVQAEQVINMNFDSLNSSHHFYTLITVDGDYNSLLNTANPYFLNVKFKFIISETEYTYDIKNLLCDFFIGKGGFKYDGANILKDCQMACFGKIRLGEIYCYIGVVKNSSGRLVLYYIDERVLLGKYNIPTIWKGTQSEYDELGSYDARVLYLITE